MIFLGRKTSPKKSGPNSSNCSVPSLTKQDELTSVESKDKSDFVSKHPSMKDPYASFDSEEQSSDESSSDISMPELCAKYEDSSDDDSICCLIPTFFIFNYATCTMAVPE